MVPHALFLLKIGLLFVAECDVRKIRLRILRRTTNLKDVVLKFAHAAYSGA